MSIRRLVADAVKRDKLYKFVCVDPVELTELEAKLDQLQKTAHDSNYTKCPHFGTIPMFNEDTGLEEPLHLCTSGGHFA